MQQLWIAVSALVLTLPLACSPKDLYWTRANSGADAFENTSASCTQQATRQAEQEQSTAPSGTVGSSGGGYGSADRRTTPNSENERRRLERRVRYYYGLCMETRGWQSNTTGQGFKGL